MWPWFLGLVYENVIRKSPEMKINDGCGFSHLHEAVGHVERAKLFGHCMVLTHLFQLRPKS